MRGEAGAGPTWVRGEARVHRGWVLLDETTVEPYAPLREPDLLREFVAIGSSRDVLRFAARFGLLRDGLGSDLREPISQWWEEIGRARCLECGGTFVVHDRRQRYCSERHASRARYRRFTDRNRLTTAS